jgi:hypothetical protein
VELFYNLTLGAFVRAIGLPTVVGSLRLKARDTQILDVRFHSGTLPVAMPAGLDLVFAIKDGYAAASVTLALVDSWTEVADGHYRALLFLNTAEVVAAIGDAASLAAFGELSWSSVPGQWQSSPTLQTRIDNDVYKGIEGTPLELRTPIGWLGDRVMIRTLGEGAPAANPATLVITGSLNDGTDPVVFPPLSLLAVRYDDRPAWGDGGDHLVRYYANLPGGGWGITSTEGFWGSSGGGSAVRPDLVAMWIPIDPATGIPSLAFTAEPVLGEFLGQLCRLGNTTPYSWYQWDGMDWQGSLDPLLIDLDTPPEHGGGIARVAGAFEVVLWNSTQEIFQILRLTGAAGFESVEITDLP